MPTLKQFCDLKMSERCRHLGDEGMVVLHQALASAQESLGNHGVTPQEFIDTLATRIPVCVQMESKRLRAEPFAALLAKSFEDYLTGLHLTDLVGCIAIRSPEHGKGVLLALEAKWKKIVLAPVQKWHRAQTREQAPGEDQEDGAHPEATTSSRAAWSSVDVAGAYQDALMALYYEYAGLNARLCYVGQRPLHSLLRTIVKFQCGNQYRNQVKDSRSPARTNRRLPKEGVVGKACEHNELFNRAFRETLKKVRDQVSRRIIENYHLCGLRQVDLARDFGRKAPAINRLLSREWERAAGEIERQL